MKRYVLTMLFALLGMLCLYSQGQAESETIPDPVPANPMEPADPAILSKPLDPWSIEPVKVDTMYLVLPFLKDGKTEHWGYTFMKELQEGMIPCFSRSMGLFRGTYTWNMIHRMSEYSHSDVIELTDTVVDDVIKFSKATHVISGSYQEHDGNWKITVTVNKGATEWTNTFEIPKEQAFLFRRDVVAWMADCGALELKDPKAKQAAKMLPYGDKVLSYDNKLYEKMTSDPHHEEWDILTKKYGETDYHQFLRLCAAIEAEDQKMIAKLTPGPLDRNASFFKRMARKNSLIDQKENDAARHELELILATYPGIIGQANAYINYTFSEGQMRENYIHAVEQWCSRVSQYPRANILAGGAMKSAAWDYRGSGFASTVSPNARKKFKECGRKGIAYYETAMKAGIPEPEAIEDLMLLKMAVEGNKEEGMKLHRQASERYPDESDTWHMVLEYSRPRWGGNNQLAMKFIDEMLASQPDNILLGNEVVFYHYGEASYESKESSWDSKKEYLKRHPDRKEQLIKATKPMLAEDAPDSWKAYALSVWAIGQDRKMIQEILTKYPDVVDHLTEGSCYYNKVGFTRYQVLYHMVSLGQWKKLREIIPEIRKEDAKYKETEGKEYCIADISGYEQFDAYEALAIAMGGDFEKGIELLEAIPPHPGHFLYLPYIRAHYACITNKDLEDIEAYANYYTKDPDPYYIRALYYLKKKDNDLALKEVEKARSKSGTAWVSLKAEVDRLLKKVEATQQGQ